VMRTTQKHSTSIFLWASSWCLPSGTGLMMIMLQTIADSSHTLAALDACYPRVVNMQKSLQTNGNVQFFAWRFV
jgi:hypothetical protein